MRAESSECKGACSVPGPSARAASTSSRFVSDFEPGRCTTADSGAEAVGAAHARECVA